MWVNRDWVGRQFPVDTPRGQELVAYARWCTAVEGNTTFYALPAEQSVVRWHQQAPPGFWFMFKLPKEITHDRRLRSVDRPLSEFLGRIDPLRPVMGPLSVQLPESFGPADLDVLDQFLATAPAGYEWAVEVRHRGFDAGSAAEHDLNQMLAGHQVDRVLFDTSALFAATPGSAESVEAHARKPRVRLRPLALAAHPVLRLIVEDDHTLTIEQLVAPWRRWFPHIARWIGDGRHVLVFAHTPDNLRAPELARLVYQEVAALSPGLSRLPDPSQVPGQIGLF